MQLLYRALPRASAHPWFQVGTGGNQLLRRKLLEGIFQMLRGKREAANSHEITFYSPQ